MEYNKEEFEKQYRMIYESLIKENVSLGKRCVIFLGGQPGSGKSTFVEQDDVFLHYIRINGPLKRWLSAAGITNNHSQAGGAGTILIICQNVHRVL